MEMENHWWNILSGVCRSAEWLYHPMATLIAAVPTQSFVATATAPAAATSPTRPKTCKGTSGRIFAVAEIDCAEYVSDFGIQ